MLQIKELLKQNEIKLKQIYKDTEDKILNIAKAEFSDFDQIKISCNEHNNEIQLQKGNNWARYYFSIYAHNGWYVRKSSFGGGFSKSELKRIKERLNNFVQNNI